METNGNDRDGPGSNYTQYPNEIVEVLARFGPEPLRIFHAVMRLTLGFQKPNGRVISLKKLSTMTGIPYKNINRAIKSAIEGKFIFTREDKNGVIYRINKNSHEYFLSSRGKIKKHLHRGI